ncbi:MAG: acyl-CoA dehydrogenase [Oceanococcaceae bacterium]
MLSQDFIHARDLWFWLYECGEAEAIGQAAAVSRAEAEALWDAASEVADKAFSGLAAEVDADEPRLENGKVILPSRLPAALQAWIDAGFHAAPFATEWGGSGLPFVFNQLLQLPANAVGGSATGYLFLTQAAANMLAVVGSPEQKARYLPPMVRGEAFGTMMLSEPQAGSSLADIRTRARRREDGLYTLHGGKMWISAGDHDLAQNIFHMVLAKVEDASGQLPLGTAGISLFLVPKYQMDADGQAGERNGVQISGLNHKMGNRGTVNTVPVLGDGAPCVGELLGTEGKGLAGMFHMMNEARIGVGMAAAQTAWFGYRYALSYAQDRPQGRLAGAGSDSPQVPIVEHADVRRMLLAQKALSEGGMALCFYAAELADRIRLADEATRPGLESRLSLLTPIVKSWPSIWGQEVLSLGIQTLGGYGYTREYPLERLYRDNRLNEIHEGTTGIQSLDLLGRKVLSDGGKALGALLQEMGADADSAASAPALAEFASALHAAASVLQKTSMALGAAAQQHGPAVALTNSKVYLDLCGHVVLAWLWLRMARTAQCALDQGTAATDESFYRGKIRACQYFFRWELPKIEAWAQLLQTLDTTCAEAQPEEF